MMEPRNPETERPSTDDTEVRDAARGRSGIRLGRVFGLEISLDVSLIVIFSLVVLSLGSGTLRVWHPDWPQALRWSVALGAAVLFFASVLAHELAHAAVARAQGIRVRGITLFMFGGLAQIESEPTSPGREFVMAIVGPLTSIGIGIAALVAGRFIADGATFGADPMRAARELGPVPTLLLWLGPVNLLLGVFNLIPGFPMDGGRVLRAFLWSITGSLTRATRYAAMVGEAFAWLFIGAGLLMAFGWVLPVVGGGLFQGLWFVLIGWFLASSARTGLARLLARRALAGVPVKQLMLRRFESVDPHLKVDRFVREYVLTTDQRCFPVVSGSRFLGLVCWGDVRATDQAAWENLELSQIMTPAARIGTVRPDDDSARALDELAQRDVDQIAVVDGEGHLAGLLRRRDLVKWMSLLGAERAESDVSSSMRPGARRHA
jgi:Zn-dependent protease